jgi:hypothetical protein
MGDAWSDPFTELERMIEEVADREVQRVDQDYEAKRYTELWICEGFRHAIRHHYLVGGVVPEFEIGGK